MKITNYKIERDANVIKVSASVDGFELWYKVPSSFQVSETANPFIAAALLPAMLKGENIDLDPRLNISKKLLSNLLQLQEIHHSWNPVLKMIQINAVNTITDNLILNQGIISFFSGGVDSMYTFLKRINEISHVVYMHGFDFLNNTHEFEEAVKLNSDFVQSFGKELIPVETNFYDFGYRYNLSRNLTQGSCLGSVALLLGFHRVFIPASVSYSQLFPLGSHPLTDPLWVNEQMEIIHDGCEVTRTEKLIKISNYDTAISNLRVCFSNMNKNCGQCSKCLRTMIGLELLNIKSESFPPLPPLRLIKKAPVRTEIMYFKESIDFAMQGNNVSLRNALVVSLKKQQKRQLFRDIDNIFFYGMFLKVKKRFVKDQKNSLRIDTTPL